MPHVITRSIRLNQPHTALEITNHDTHEIPVPEALQDIQRLITLTHDIIQSHLTLTEAYSTHSKIADYQAWAKEIDEPLNRKPTTIPARVALRSDLRYKNEIPREVKVASRVEYIIQAELVSKLKSWDLNPRHLPKAGWAVNLGYADSQMTRITQQGKTVKLYLKAWDREVILIFRKPSASLKKKEKLGLPIINMDPITGRLTFTCPVQEKVPLPVISHDYVIGVDRGISKYFTFAVIDMRTGEPMFITDSTGRLEEAHLKVHRQDEQVRGLHGKINKAIERRDYATARELEVELDRVRKARSRLKLQLAREAAKFIISVSREYGNAVICMEDLSWSGSWGSREPYGMLLHETEWQAEKDGLLCYTVPAAYSSQACSRCQAGSFEPVSHSFTGRVYHCAACGFADDRDVNAAVNLAARGVGRARKSAVTRDRSKEVPTPKRVARGVVRCRARIRPVSNVNDLDSVVAGGGSRLMGAGRTVPSGRGEVDPVAGLDCGLGWLTCYGIRHVRMRI